MVVCLLPDAISLSEVPVVHPLSKSFESYHALTLYLAPFSFIV